jgi:Gpi18-like mannosyltransferase
MKILKNITVFSLVFLALFFLSIPHYSGDVWNHLVWGKSIADYGTFGFYSRTFKDIAFPNYPPFAMMLFAASYKIYQIIYQLAWYLNQNLGFFPSNFIYFLQSNNVQIAFLKIPTITASILISYILFKVAPKILDNTAFKKNLLLAALFILNPAIFYLSVVWGQIDLIPILFLFLSSYFIFSKNLFLISVFASLALLTKQTIIIFWFIQIIFMLKILGVKKTFISAGITFAIIYLFYIPFLGINPLEMINLYQANFTYVAELSQVNSINLWGFLYDLQPVSDHKLFMSFSYNFIGKALFIGALIPVLLALFTSKIERFKKDSQIYVLVYVFFITTILYFLLLTRMHERYLIPAVVFIYVLIIHRKFHVFNLIFFSFLVFINLYRGLLVPESSILKTLVFSTPFLEVLFVIYFLLAFYNIVLFARTLGDKANII